MTGLNAIASPLISSVPSIPYSISKRRTCRLSCYIRRNTAGSRAASQSAFVSPPALPPPPRRPRPGLSPPRRRRRGELAPSGEAARCRRQPLIAAVLPTQSSSSPLLARPAAFNHRSPAPLRSRVDGWDKRVDPCDVRDGTGRDGTMRVGTGWGGSSGEACDGV